MKEKNGSDGPFLANQLNVCINIFVFLFCLIYTINLFFQNCVLREK